MLGPFHVKQEGLNTSRDWKRCEWNIPAKETWSGSLKRSLEVTWVPLRGSTFARVTSAASPLRQRPREQAHCCVNREHLYDSVSFSSTGPETHSAPSADGPCTSYFIYLTPGFPFKAWIWTETRNLPTVLSVTVTVLSEGDSRHLQSETLSVESSWQLTYDMLDCWG